MDKRLLSVIGIIGGILALVGVFSPWDVASGYGMSYELSAWDYITQADVWLGNEYLGQVDFSFSALIILVGAVALLVAALATLASPDTRMLWSIVFNAGIIVIIGTVWAFIDLAPETVYGVSFGYGYGLYLMAVGGVLGLSGFLGRKSSDY